MKQSDVGGKEWGPVSREKKEAGDNQPLRKLPHLHGEDLCLQSRRESRSRQITKDSGCNKKFVAAYLLSHQPLLRTMLEHYFQENTGCGGITLHFMRLFFQDWWANCSLLGLWNEFGINRHRKRSTKSPKNVNNISEIEKFGDKKQSVIVHSAKIDWLMQ